MLFGQTGPSVVVKRIQIAGRFPQSYYRAFYYYYLFFFEHACVVSCTRGNLISVHFNPFLLIIHIYMDVFGIRIHFNHSGRCDL